MGLALLLAIVAGCVIVPTVSRWGPDRIVALPYLPPSVEHLFGTDSVGRDLFARVFAAGRLDLGIAAAAVLAALLIGSGLGTLVAGARWAWIDAALMRLVDAVIAFPFLVLVLVLAAILGTDRAVGPLPAGAPAVLCGVVLGDWVFYARLARAQTLALKRRDYVVAAHVLGLSPWRITSRHLLPGVLSTVVAYAITDMVLVMITVASLSFIGLGVQPPAPEWGALMYEGRSAIYDAWWIAVIPGLMLALTGLSLSLIADGFLSKRQSGV
jgi:peptide/nickel transport system permease protein